MNIFKNTALRLIGFKNKLYNHFAISLKNVFYDTYPIINGKLYLSGTGRFQFGKEVRINSSLSSNPIGGDQKTILSVSPNALLEIGDFCGISNSTIICRANVKIGRYVKIGGSVKIYDTDFHSLDYLERKDAKTDTPLNKPVKIGDYCFIGAHSIILKGVTIGEKSIIGAGSVVTKSIPECEIWGGNPAKFIRKVN